MRRQSSSSTGGKESGRGGRWSARVTEHSDALDLEPGLFLLEDPRAVALSLKRSADRSKRRKAEPYRSAMSMLVFYINRAGRNLPRQQRALLEAAKDELRKAYGRPTSDRTRKHGTAPPR